MKRSETLLMVADTDHDANMLYTTGIGVPDPFIYLQIAGRPSIVMSDLEIDRAKKKSPCRVIALSQVQQRLRAQGIKRAGYANVIREILRAKKINRVIVPDNFPFGLALELKKLGIKANPIPNFFPDREFKSADEVRKISAALTMAEVGMSEAMQVLRRSKVGRARKLMYHGLPLTSERLRSVIDCAILRAGGLAAHTI